MTLSPGKLSCKKALLLSFLLLKTFFSVAQLQADFTMDKAGGCSPLTMSFINASTGTSGTTTYKWDLGNGNTSTLKNAGDYYKDEKTYSVTLTVNSGGQSSTKTKQFTVYKKPTVDFSASKRTGCAPLGVDFTGNSTAGDGNVSSYFWDFGDGATQSVTAAQINHTYNFAQKSSVSLTVTNSYGCYNTLSKSELIDVQPGIKAGFAADKTVLCKTTDAVTFNNSSTGPAGMTYLWDFGDGKTSVEQSPTYTYNQKGIFNVKLTVSSASGCSETVSKTGYINVANFTTSFDLPASVCEKSNVVFTNTSTPTPASVYWELDNNSYSYSNSANYYFNTPGDHTIKLTNTFGTCAESISKTVSVKKAPQINGFVANLGGVCGAPVTVTFKDTSTEAVKWLWNFNYPYSQNTSTVKEPSFTFTSESYYTVGLTITNSDGCTATTSKPVNIAKPNIAINVLSTSGGNYASGCTGLTMKFAGTPATEITDYKWDFGDGGTSTVAEPEHTFSAAGNHIVRLTYTTVAGCKGTVQYYPITVYQKPKVDFSSLSGTTICGNTPVNFSATSTNSAGLYNLYWLFGDDIYTNYFNSANVTHQYYKDSTYTVTLIASNGSCSDTVTKKDYIKVLPPFPKIASATNTCEGTRGIVTFVQTSKKAISGTWDFGDGTTQALNINQSSLSHTYTKTGAFKVVLTTVNDQCAVRDSLTAYVLLKQKPLLASLKTEICGSDNVDIKISNLETNPYPSSYYYYYPYDVKSYQYGDGTTFSGSASSNNYYNWTTEYKSTLQGLSNGKKDLKAIIHSGYFDCADTTNLIPLKIKGPVADFSITQNSPCFKYPVIFSDKSKVQSDVAIKTWEWNFGNGFTKKATDNSKVEYIYTDPGYYDATLKVTDADGCIASTTSYLHTVTVSGPKANFTYYPASVSPNTSVSFYNNTNNYNSYNSTFIWIFPDGTTSSNYYPSYTFTKLGTDTVKLVATNPSTGCTDTAIQVINVKNVNAKFTYATSYINNNSCPPVVVKFTNTSLNYNSVSWDFGDGSKADNQNFPSHTYYNPGVYNVTLYIKGFNNLTDSTTEAITVKGPYAILKADVMSGCTSQEVTLSADVKNAVNYKWAFGDGTVLESTDTFAVHQYASAGVYTAALLLQDAGGCPGTSELQNKIVIDTLDLSLKNDPAIVCNAAFAYFTPTVQSLAADQLQQALQYKWQFGTGVEKDTSNLGTPSFSYPNPGKYAVHVKVTSPYGCVKEATDSIQVLQRANANIQSLPEICQGTRATFTGTADIATGVTWKWLFGNGDTANIQNPPSQLYVDSGTVKVRLVVNNAGCYDTALNDLVVRPKPNINLTPKQSNICLGKSVQLTAGGGDLYSWRPDAGLDNYAIAQPVASPAKDTRYQVEVTNAFGCKNVDSAMVTVSAPFKVKLPVDPAICQGKELQLIAGGAASYKWINNTTGISDVNIGNPITRSLAPVVYTVVGYDAYNCFSDTASVKVQVVPLPTISIGPDLQLLTGSNVVLQTTASSDVTKYNWSPADGLSCTDCAAPVSTPRTNITYIVTGTTRFGCAASDTLNIKLICDQSHVYIPTAFTPNNDYKNDVFYIKGRGVKMIRFLKIYNRFGEAIFEKDNFQIEDRSAGWDGKQKGVEVPTGAYVYFTEMVCDNGEIFSLKGTVMVVK